MDLSLPVLVELRTIRVDGVLPLVVERLDTVFCVIVAVPTHHIPEPRTQADVSEDFVKDM